MLRMLKRLLVALLAALFWGPALAEAPVPQTAPAATARTRAAPAFWRVTGKHGTVYLLGSVHALSPEVDWRTPAIDTAMKSASVFAFEIPNDQSTIDKTRTLITTRGMLPPDSSLRDMLTPAAQADFDAVVTQTRFSPDALSHMRPWVADLVLSFALFQKRSGASPVSGVDMVLEKQVEADKHEIRYMETVEQQMALLAPDDPKIEIQQFESDLGEMRSQPDEAPKLLDAWARGDVDAIDKLSFQSFKGHDAARKAFVDDRNAAWVKKLEAWIDGENTVFFVTVGAAHLVGDRGVPALLKADGYKVTGPLH